MHSLPIERITPRGMMNLDNYAGLNGSTNWIDAGAFHSWLVVVALGPNTSPSIAIKLQQAKDSLGAGIKDIPGKTWTHADPATGQRLFLLNLLGEELDIAQGFRYFRPRVDVTGGTATWLGAVALGVDPRFGKAQEDRIPEVLAVVE